MNWYNFLSQVFISFSSAALHFLIAHSMRTKKYEILTYVTYINLQTFSISHPALPILLAASPLSSDTRLCRWNKGQGLAREPHPLPSL